MAERKNKRDHSEENGGDQQSNNNDAPNSKLQEVHQERVKKKKTKRGRKRGNIECPLFVLYVFEFLLEVPNLVRPLVKLWVPWESTWHNFARILMKNPKPCTRRILPCVSNYEPCPTDPLPSMSEVHRRRG